MAHIQRLEDALGDVDFEQHWLRTQTEREGLSKDPFPAFNFAFFER
jgi:hypothetical protein